ncbi:MAG: hypothetical protein WC023_08865 [Rhodocyclaceae bacterium]|jgi:hypothetical protein
MSTIRSTTAPSVAIDATDRHRLTSRTAVQPVYLEREIDADRRRSLREELDAAEERFSTAAPEDALVDTQDVLEALSRLGGEAANLLKPINTAALRLVGEDHVDEQA